MPLPLPTLDDRTYDDLREEILDLLPINAPDWTDYNASDPGITVLELFSYLTESLLYRLDRVPERQQRAFLRLVGCEPRLAKAASALVVFQPAAGAVDLPAGVQISNVGGDIVFQTGTPFHVSKARLKTVITTIRGRVEDHSAANVALDAPFFALGADPQVGDSVYLGFDDRLGDAGARIRVFVIGEDGAADLETWRALRDELRAVAKGHESCPRIPHGVQQFWQHYGVRVAWEYYSAQGWKLLPSLKDWTRGLSLSGPVRWRAPRPDQHLPGGVDGYAATYFIRCRLIDGEYDCPPRIRGVRANAVVARHAADVESPFTLGNSTGHAGQHFRLPQAPVVPGSTRFLINRAPGPEWSERPDFDRSGPHAKHYVLASATGEVSFGDGRAGRVPKEGSELAMRWKVGGGAAGNAPKHTLCTLPVGAPNARIPGWEAISDVLAVCQPLAACGGEDAESLEAAKARGFREIVSNRCAVTLKDLERVALAVPGVPIARAYAIADFHPELSCLSAAGCVTVVIIPRCIESHPHPTDAMCRAVASAVAHRRPVALEVHVVGPEYTVVTVNAKLALERGADSASVKASADSALRAFLHPLPKGSDSKGWTVGRSVYRSEILALLDGVAGVDYVAELTLAGDNGTPAKCGDIPICPHGLPISGEHRVSTV